MFVADFIQTTKKLSIQCACFPWLLQPAMIALEAAQNQRVESLGKQVSVVKFGQVVVPEANVVAFGVAFAKTNSFHLAGPISKHRHHYVPGSCTLDVLHEVLGTLGVACLPWVDIKRRIREHHLGRTATPQHLEGVIDLDPSESENDEDNEDELENAAVAALAQGTRREELQAVIQRLQAKCTRIRLNRNYWKQQAAALRDERDELKSELAEIRLGGKKQGSRKNTTPRFFTPLGGLSMGLRANLCHTPASFFRARAPSRCFSFFCHSLGNDSGLMPAQVQYGIVFEVGSTNATLRRVLHSCAQERRNERKDMAQKKASCL